ncbi:cyclin-A3-2-like [Curcuma longa]|uniref:cyclin-A3-2-like n=1 Tax=Curcuma longa TaxID=136217 RepID=UPI003D9EECB4
MPEEQINPRLTQAAAERADSASVIAASAPVSKRSPTKRNHVALGELRSFANTNAQISASDNSVSPSNPIPNTERKKAKHRPASSADESSQRDDPQMATPYASDIYQYLRSIEVRGSSA